MIGCLFDYLMKPWCGVIKWLAKLIGAAAWEFKVNSSRGSAVGRVSCDTQSVADGARAFRFWRSVQEGLVALAMRWVDFCLVLATA